MENKFLESILANGVVMVLLGIFIRSWIANVRADITRLFKLHGKCVKKDDCNVAQKSMARKIHAEGNNCKSQASIDLLKHYHNDKGKVAGI